MVRFGVCEPLKEGDGFNITDELSWYLRIHLLEESVGLKIHELSFCSWVFPLNANRKRVFLIPVLEPADLRKLCPCIGVWCSIFPYLDNKLEMRSWRGKVKCGYSLLSFKT